ncbi:hypothetical protein BJ742DRAFT_784964 [Cladochytrium replicatum]|nr:hypothetical protein BJ742DRAFT_784964 [Cladochytrium replicatum]
MSLHSSSSFRKGATSGGNSQKMAVEELASDAMKETKTAGFSLPLSAAIVSLLIPALCLTVIPSSTLLLKAMSSSNEILAGKVLNSVVDHVNIQVTSTLNSSASLILSSVRNPSVIDLVTRSSNFSGNSRLNLWMNNLLNQTSLDDPLLVFCQRKNLTSSAPADAPNDRMNVWWGRSTVNWCDYTNNSSCTMGIFNQSTGALIVQTGHPYIKPSMVTPSFICSIQSSCPKSDGIWLAESSFGNTLWFTFALCGPPVAQFGPTPAFSSGFPILAGEMIAGIFTKLAPSENARVFLIDGTGNLLATRTLVNAVSSGDATISLLAQDIEMRTDSYKSISSVIGSLTRVKLPNDEWTYSVRTLQVPSSVSMYLVAAIPRRDFFSVIDNAERTSVTVTVVFAAISIMVVIGVIVGITLPIRRLTGEMTKVATFDFSMLERGFFIENSLFTEIRKMQVTFNTLVKAFAGAIARNRGLTNNASVVTNDN